MRIKKKIEANINELEIALDHANKANAEATKQVYSLMSSQESTLNNFLMVKTYFVKDQTISWKLT